LTLNEIFDGAVKPELDTLKDQLCRLVGAVDQETLDKFLEEDIATFRQTLFNAIVKEKDSDDYEKRLFTIRNISDEKLIELQETLSKRFKSSIRGYEKYRKIVDSISNHDLFQLKNGTATGELSKVERLLRQTELSWQDSLYDDEESYIEDEKNRDDHADWERDDLETDDLMDDTPPLRSIDQAGYTYWHVNKINEGALDAGYEREDKEPEIGDPITGQHGLLWQPENRMFREAYFTIIKESRDPGTFKKSKIQKIKNISGRKIGWPQWNELQFAIQKAGL